MEIVVAIDSFKGSLTSLEAGQAIRLGLLNACPDARITVMPLADGGEGTVEALTLGMGGAALETLFPVRAQPCCCRVAPQQSPFPRPAAVQSYG